MTETPMKKKKTAHDENYWMTVLLYFASFLIGLGIIALVAANWQQIPSTVKLSGALVLMAVNAGAVWWTIHAQKHILKQVLCVIYAFLIMGVLGLIGQVFQLRADVAKACLTWGFLSWPLFLIAPRLLWLWVPLFFFGLHYLPPMFAEEIAHDVFHTWDTGKTADWYLAVSTIAAYSLILAYEFYVCLKKEPSQIVVKPLRFYAGVILWGLCSRAAQYAVVTQKMTIGCLREVIVPCIIIGAIVFALNKMKNRKTLMPVFLGAAVVEYFYVFICKSMEFEPSYHWFFSRHSVEAEFPLMFLLCISTYAHLNKMKRLFRLSMVALCAWFAWTFGDDIFDLIPSLILCAFAAFWAYKAQSRRWFNASVIAAVLRILGYYSNVSNLTYFGCYLIGSGLLVIVTILLLMKYSKKLWEKNDEK